MELVIDTNIFIAAFLKSATTRSLLLDTRLKLYSSESCLRPSSRYSFVVERWRNEGADDGEGGVDNGCVERISLDARIFCGNFSK